MIIAIYLLLTTNCSLELNGNETTNNQVNEKNSALPSETTNSNTTGQTQISPSADTLTVALIMLRNGKQQSVETSKVFIKKDGVRLNVSVVEKGYLNILYKGSNGESRVLFPSKDYFNGKNDIDSNQNIVIPNKGWFLFDEKKGTETIFVVYSKKQPSKEITKNAPERSALFENLRSENNNSDSFTTKDGDLIRVIELKHN